LHQTKERLAKLARAEIKLTEFCARVRETLAQCPIQDKRLALDALDVMVTATREQVDIKGVMPIDITTTQTYQGFTTIERTSACLLTWAYSCFGQESQFKLCNITQ